VVLLSDGGAADRGGGVVMVVTVGDSLMGVGSSGGG
jgi:hypothetical protein